MNFALVHPAFLALIRKFYRTLKGENMLVLNLIDIINHCCQRRTFN